MTFLLDTNVVSYFFQVRRSETLAAAATTVPCAIADEVRVELESDRTRGTRFIEWLPHSGLRVIPIVVGSPADGVLARLATSGPGAAPD
jgi:hypothetical protein